MGAMIMKQLGVEFIALCYLKTFACMALNQFLETPRQYNADDNKVESKCVQRP